MNQKVEYFSKWRNKWVEMKDPTPGKIAEMKRFYYQIRVLQLPSK